MKRETAPTACSSATAPRPSACGRRLPTPRRRIATLLISGPPGSDHEAVARAVHHQSARASRAIICVNCLAVGRHLAFVRRDRRSADVRGKLRLADGGTLYLEGIQHLRREWQEMLVEMLRALDLARPSSERASA